MSTENAPSTPNETMTKAQADMAEAAEQMMRMSRELRRRSDRLVTGADIVTDYARRFAEVAANGEIIADAPVRYLADLVADDTYAVLDSGDLVSRASEAVLAVGRARTHLATLSQARDLDPSQNG